MAEEPEGAAPRRRLPRVTDLLEITDEMIAFADTYQQVWENEAKATIALGEFLNARASSLRSELQLFWSVSSHSASCGSESEAVSAITPAAAKRRPS